MIVRLIQILSYYPVVLVSGILLLVARAFGWGCLVAFLLFGGFELSGELEVSSWSMAALLGGGVLTLLLANGYVALLSRLGIGDSELVGGQQHR